MGICFSIEEQKHPSDTKFTGHESAASTTKQDRSTSNTPLAPMNIKDLRLSPVYNNVHIFTYEELTLATKHFRPDLILGEGGFGVVYKGVVDATVRPGYKTTQVAIKELNREGFQGDREWLVTYLIPSIFLSPSSSRLRLYMKAVSSKSPFFWVTGSKFNLKSEKKEGCTCNLNLNEIGGQKMFWIALQVNPVQKNYDSNGRHNILILTSAEVNYLGQFSHPNLVNLIGYCCEDEHRLLVYEYMASGSLEKHLFRRVGSTLTWSKRMKIALHAAKGLAFLHGAERPIIYRDFKTSNILLDADFNAKLSDFGLAKDGPMGDQTHVSTRVMGTYGYAAPEYVMTGHLTARSDVYGFGVVLLEMLIGRKALDKSRPSREHNLVEWARPLLNHNKKLLKILDPRMEGQYSTRTAVKVAHLAYQCLSQNPKGRPLMSQVVEILENFQSKEKIEEEQMLSGGSSITIYEVPKGASGTPTEVKRQIKDDEVYSSKGRREKSRSEPSNDCDLCSLPPDLLPQQKSASSRR